MRPGGRHPGLGTHNAIIRFGLEYIELISICDRDEAKESGQSGKVLVDALRTRDDFPAGFAIATSDIETDAERLRQGGFEATGPFAMQRLRPDGKLLSWRLLVLGGVMWCRPWPFLIQWDAPDEERLLWERPGRHDNGATGVENLTVDAKDLARATALYRRGFRFPETKGDSTFAIGSLTIRVQATTGPQGPSEVVVRGTGRLPTREM